MKIIASVPVATVSTRLVCFEIYRAKDIGSSKWDSDLFEVVRRARESYVPPYGNVPLLDGFDFSAAVYLVRMRSVHAEEHCWEEWLSARFIFANHYMTPPRTHKLLQYLYRGQPFIEALDGILPQAARRVAVISRICGFATDCDALGESTHAKLHFTAQALALMVKQFIIDYKKKRDLCLLMGLFRDELIQKALTKEIDGRFLPVFFSATDIFRDSRPDDFCIDRGISAYNFPAYFFDTKALARLLAQLVHDGSLSSEIVRKHLEHPERIVELLNGEDLPYNEFRKMGPLLSRRGHIHGTRMTGEALRCRISHSVPDGPHLRMLEVESLLSTIPKLLEFV